MPRAARALAATTVSRAARALAATTVSRAAHALAATTAKARCSRCFALRVERGVN